MGEAAIKIKIMPESPDVDLNELAEKAKTLIAEQQGEVVSSEQEPVAFGLKAIIIMVRRDENLEQDPLMEPLQKLDSVSSAEIIDFRRIGF